MIHIGTSGWSYDHWIGRFYPPGMAKSKWLGFYTNYFKTVELNMTFYRHPSFKTIDRWIEKTPDDFRFCIKASHLITHERKLDDSHLLIERQKELIERFRGKVSCVLYQLPPSFAFNNTNTSRLDRFIDCLDKENLPVFEFRHQSWWNEKTKKILENRAAFCSVVGLDMPFHLDLEQQVVYIRLHGDRYHGSYSEKWLNNLAEQIRPVKESHDIYIYFNNDVDCCAVENGKALMKILL